MATTGRTTHVAKITTVHPDTAAAIRIVAVVLIGTTSMATAATEVVTAAVRVGAVAVVAEVASRSTVAWTTLGATMEADMTTIRMRSIRSRAILSFLVTHKGFYITFVCLLLHRPVCQNGD